MMEVPFHRPSVGTEELDLVRDVLESGWLTTGEVSMELEKVCAEYLGVKKTLAVSSGTAALAICYRLAGFPGEKVVVPSYTFVSCVTELLHMNAIPVLVDIDPSDMNLDTDRALETAERHGAAGIVTVHFAGQPCDMHRLERETRIRGLSLVDDACHAYGSRSGGRMIGSFDSCSAFSFYATKNITSGEGGLVSTALEGMMERARVLSLHGISRDAWKRYRSGGSWFYEVVEAGYKANLPDLLAAVGLAQARRADELLRLRGDICRRYDLAFSDFPELFTLPAHVEGESSYHLYPLRLSPSISRDEVARRLRARGVGCSVHFIPVHLHPYFRENPSKFVQEDLVNTEEAYRSELSLPLWPDMTEEQTKFVIASVLEEVGAV